MMRACVLCLALAVPAAAQEASGVTITSEAGPSNFVVQPLPWAFGSYAASYQHALNEKLALSIGMNLLFALVSTNQNNNSVSTTFVGFGAQPGVHYYLKGRAPVGLWVGPALELQYLSSTTSQSSGSSSASSNLSGFLYGINVMAGYTHRFDFGLVLEGGVGLGFASSSFTTSSGGSSSPPFAVTSSLGRLSLGAGWNF